MKMSDEAFLPLLADRRDLRAAQQRLAHALARRVNLVPHAEARGFRRHHLPPELRFALDVARALSQQQIRDLVRDHPNGNVARAYLACVELDGPKAEALARQIILSLNLLKILPAAGDANADQ
jgi:hypothetical protein